MLFVVSGVPLRVKKIKCSGSSAASLTKRWRRTSEANDGTDTVRVDFIVLGWLWRWVGFPLGETIVPHSRTVAGELVTSTSHLRIARTSPMRADVPSMTSMICSSWPSGGGPEKPGPLQIGRAHV